MAALLVIVHESDTPSEVLGFAFNPGTPQVADTVTTTEFVRLAPSVLLVDVEDDAGPSESWQVFALDFQDTQGGGGSGAATELWRPVWLIDLSAMTIIPSPFVANDLKFSNVDLDSFDPPYHGRILDNPVIDRSLMNTFWGFTEVSTVKFTLANNDGRYNSLFIGVDLREQPVIIKRYDVASGTTVEELRARISSVGLANGEVVITADSPALTLFEQVIPKKKIELTEFPKAVDVGKVIPVPFGNEEKLVAVYVKDDTLNNIYDYIVGPGSLTVSAVYRTLPDNSFERAGVQEYSVSETIYPGYTAIRFPNRQVDFSNNFHTIYVDVSSSSRNFARAIQSVLTNTVWGLGQIVDTGSFDLAAQKLDDLGLLCDGAIRDEDQAQDVLNSLMIVRGMRLGFNASGQWTIAVDEVPPSVSMRLRDGPGDGERNILSAGTRQLVPARNAVSKYLVNYRFDVAKGEFLFTQNRIVSGIGKEKKLDAPFIRDHVTADKVTDYLAKREKYGQETCEFVITQEARKMIEGKLVTVVYAPCGYNDDIVEIREAEKRLEQIRLVVSGWDQSIFVYEPGIIPSDSGTDTPTGTLFIPRPGGLEIPGQALDQEFQGCDIALHWHKVSELFIGNQDEENLPGREVEGYWVTVYRNLDLSTPTDDTLLREEFVIDPEYNYPFSKNKADTPPSGARQLTFKIQAQTFSGILGEPNYITVFNGEQNLASMALGPVWDTDIATESVTIVVAFAPGQVWDFVPTTEFVDVVVGGRRINVFDDDRFIDQFDVVDVQINGRSVNVADFIDEYDHVERIEASGGRAIVLSDDIQGTDSVTVVRSALTINVSDDDTFLPFFPQPREGVTIVRS